MLKYSYPDCFLYSYFQLLFLESIMSINKTPFLHMIKKKSWCGYPLSISAGSHQCTNKSFEKNVYPYITFHWCYQFSKEHWINQRNITY